jgi:hypothetical protein
VQIGTRRWEVPDPLDEMVAIVQHLQEHLSLRRCHAVSPQQPQLLPLGGSVQPQPRDRLAQLADSLTPPHGRFRHLLASPRTGALEEVGPSSVPRERPFGSAPSGAPGPTARSLSTLACPRTPWTACSPQGNIPARCSSRAWPRTRSSARRRPAADRPLVEDVEPRVDQGDGRVGVPNASSRHPRARHCGPDHE